MRKLKISITVLLLLSLIAVTYSCKSMANQEENIVYQSQDSTDFVVPEIVGCPTNCSVIVNVVPAKNMEIYIEYGTQSGKYADQTEKINAEASIPQEILIDKLQANTRYYYRIRYALAGQNSYTAVQDHSFMTQRASGSTFVFDIQGDSHPERDQKEFDPALYMQTMKNVQEDRPDFYFLLGDDFSVDTMKTVTKDAIRQLYVDQRNFLSTVGNSSPLFLVNGNHEQEAQYLLDGTPNNVAVWQQNNRNSYFLLPVPDDFYSGDTRQVEYIGQLRDYYAFTWGDALFVVIDPYWHSSVAVDNNINKNEKRSDMWDITLGEEQYQWLKKTLEESNSKYKFVFSHHVLGTGRGGIEIASQYEWGGYNKNGLYEFNKKRLGWDLPIQELMAKNGVTIFFQGHDHIFVKEELDGVIYQTLPEPADPNYALNNANAYNSKIEFPSSGHVRVTVSNDQVKVEYIKSVLPQNETNGSKNGEIIYSYTVNK